jgi:glycosyltransferase involved in cell wall biosynthesis
MRSSSDLPARDGPPVVSVIVPVLNGEATLGAQLEALVGQTFRGNWEVIVADNGSSDRSVDVARSFEGRLPGLQVLDASGRRGVSYARNVGARAARGEFFAFCDHDDVVAPGWVCAMAEAAVTFDLVGGRMECRLLNRSVVASWRHPRPREDVSVCLGFLPFAPGGNCGVRASVFRDLHGWDEDWAVSGQDVDLSWRAQLASHRLGYAPDAVVHYRFRTDLRAMARQAYRYGYGHTRLYREYRDRGVARQNAISGLKAWAFLLIHADRLSHPDRRGAWLFSLALRTGRLTGSFKNRVLLL